MSTLKIEKKIIEFFDMLSIMKKLDANPNFKFKVTLARNIKRLESELDLIKEKSRASDEFNECLSKEREVKISFANKEADGKSPKIVEKESNGEMIKVFDIPEDKLEDMTGAINAFWDEDENKRIRQEYIALINDYNKYITEEVITIELIPFNSSSIDDEWFAVNDDLADEFIRVAEELLAV